MNLEQRTKADLEKADKGVLVELVLELVQANKELTTQNQQLLDENKQLKEAVKELSLNVERLKGMLAKNNENSSKPPASDGFNKKARKTKSTFK